VPRIVGQGIAHGLDDVGHGVQADHVGSPVGRRFGTSDQGAADGVHFIETQAELGGVMDAGQDGEHADAVADEVGRVLGVDHALAQRSDQEAFQAFQHGSVGDLGRDQFGQMHVARRVEEMHAAEAVAQLFRQHIGKGVDAQAGGVAGQHGVVGHERGDLLVEVLLPVHALGDGLYDQVAAAQQFQPATVVGCAVVGGGDGLGQRFAGERSGAQLAQVGDGLQRHTVRVSFLGGQVEQHRVHTSIGQVRGDLCTHHTGAEHGGFAYKQLIRHVL